ncbi:MAG: archease [Nannocystaceae bacterium]
MGVPWEHFAHDSDIGVRGRGASVDEAFVAAGVALTAVITAPAGVAAREAVAIACEAPALDLLLVEWLDAIIFEMATRGLLFRAYSVAVGGREGAWELRGEARGEAIDVDRHAPTVEIKGATFTGLRVVEEAPGRWLAECVVDV